MKIGVFLPNWVGDAVMATPTLRAIRLQFDDAQIVGILRPVIADAMAGLPFLDRQIVHATNPAQQGLAGWQLVRQLRRERFDLAVLLPNSFRSALLAWLAGAKRRVGFARDARRWLLTDPIPAKPKHTPHPVLDEYLRLAEHLGCRDLSQKMHLVTTSDDEQRLTQFWNRYGKNLPWRRVVCLNPGGAYGSAKHWPTPYFGELARRIADELNRTVLILCGPAEQNEAREIVATARHPNVVSLADVEPSIGLTKAAIRLSELLITTDSGPRHFAPAFNVPVITLFGPTHIAWSETHYSRAVHLQIPVDCGPCQERRCPLEHHRCMRDLTVGRVFAEAVKLLTPSNPNTSAA